MKYKRGVKLTLPPEKTTLKKPSLIRVKGDQKRFLKNNKIIVKTQQGFKSERHNAFTEVITKIALRSNDYEECDQLIR